MILKFADVLLMPAIFFLTLFGIAAIFRGRGARPEFAMSAALATLCGVSTLAFWLARAFPSPLVVLANCTLMMIVSIALFWKAISARLWRDELVAPLGVSFAASVTLLLWVHGSSDLSEPLRVAAGRWTDPLPSDNQMPFALALSMLAGHVPSPFFGDWLSSDRPPLQTALFLLIPGNHSDLSYQTASVAMQMTVLLGVWVLIRALSRSNSLALLMMVCVFFTPLTLVNGAFVWPKLLAATFLLMLTAHYFSPLFDEAKEDWANGVLCGALAALAMLAHGGSAFVLLGMGASALALRRFATRQFLWCSLITLVILYGPWMAYQHFIDPPGDRLLKWHLAGIVAVDNRPLLNVVQEAYQMQSLAETLNIRVSNIETVFSGSAELIADTVKAANLAMAGSFEDASLVLRGLRNSQFYFVIAGSGVCGLLLWVLWIGFFDAVIRPPTAVLSASLLIWVGLMFAPRSTVIHQGSLFFEVALVCVSVVFVWRRWPIVAYAIIAMQSSVTIFQYTM